MTINETTIVQAIIHRDERAIAFIIAHYGGLLSAIIKRYVMFSQQDYEECLDDVLLAIWNNIGSYDESRNTFQQWIAAIAKYRGIDYYRKLKGDRQRFAAGEWADQLEAKTCEVAAVDIEELLDCLSPDERKLFRSYYLEGVPSREMAEEMNVRESWIHNKLSRGRKKLRQWLISRNEV